MTTQEAIEKLDKMQSQILHGSRIFGDIADVIHEQERWKIIAVRMAYEAQVCLDNAHWEVKFGSGDLLDTISAVKKLQASNVPDQLRLSGRKRNDQNE